MIRRAIAFILMLSFCSFALETAMADVHDGDASQSELARLAGGAPSLTTTTDQGRTPSAPERSGSQHLHVCHCSHAHGTLTMVAAKGADEEFCSDLPQGITLLIPDAVDLDVQVRPPIA